MVSFPRYFNVCITYQPPLVRPTCIIPCSADASKFWRRWLHHHRAQISFCGQRLAGVRGGENPKVLSRSCRVDAVTPSIQVVWWGPESSTLVWGLTLPCPAKAIFHPESFQAESDGRASSFFFSMLIYASGLIVVPVCIISRRITPLDTQHLLQIQPPTHIHRTLSQN